MTKIVINRKYGGFGLSDMAIQRLLELGYDPKIIEGWIIPKEHRTFGRVNQKYWGSCHELERDNPLLVQVVEELGAKANGQFANLQIVEIPDDVAWEIEQYDGNEWISEIHRTWR